MCKPEPSLGRPHPSSLPLLFVLGAHSRGDLRASISIYLKIWISKLVPTRDHFLFEGRKDAVVSVTLKWDYSHQYNDLDELRGDDVGHMLV
jgi:hypothetical protein